MALHLVGARPVREGTGRIARFELVPLEVRVRVSEGRERNHMMQDPLPAYTVSQSVVRA